MLISDLLKAFIFDLQIENYSNRTRETYSYNVGQLIQYLAEHHEKTEIEDVSSLHIKKFTKHQQAIGNKSTYINTLIKGIRAFYVFLLKEEYVALNIMSKIKLLKEDKTVIKTFSDKEVAQMIAIYKEQPEILEANEIYSPFANL